LHHAGSNNRTHIFVQRFEPFACCWAFRTTSSGLGPAKGSFQLLASISAGYGRVKSALLSTVFSELEVFKKGVGFVVIGPPSIVCANVEGVAVRSSAVGPRGCAGSVDSSTGDVDDI